MDLRVSCIHACFNSLLFSCFHAAGTMCMDKTNLRSPYHPHCGLMEEGQGEQAAKWSQPMREVCATRKACPCHGGEKSQSAHWRSARCAGAAAKGPFKGSHSETGGGWGTAKTHCQPFSLSVCLHFRLPACLPVLLFLCLFLSLLGDFSN